MKLLYESLKPEQRKEVCFAWDYVDPKRGLLRTRLENNWRITKPAIKSEFFTADQQAMIRTIFEGITAPEWHERFDKQLDDDIGGFGNKQGIAIFGSPAVIFLHHKPRFNRFVGGHRKQVGATQQRLEARQSLAHQQRLFLPVPTHELRRA